MEEQYLDEAIRQKADNFVAEPEQPSSLELLVINRNAVNSAINLSNTLGGNHD